jgi:hypothetical protein
MSQQTKQITRRVAVTTALAGAAIPIAGVVPALALAADNPIDYAGALARAEQVIDYLRTCHVCEGWHGRGLDEEAAERMLQYFRNPPPEDDPDDKFIEVVRWAADHGQSLDWIVDGEPGGMICHGAARSMRAAKLTDPIFSAIEAHRTAARAESSAICAEQDDDPRWREAVKATHAAQDAEERALLELFTTIPTTLAGAAAVLEYVGDHHHMDLKNSLAFFDRNDDVVSEAGDNFFAHLASMIRTMG